MPNSELQPFDMAMLLRHHPLLTRATAADLLALVSAARELSLKSGERLFLDDDPAALYLVVDGAVRLESEGGAPLVVEPGGTLLVAETLAGALAGWRATAARPCRILRVERDDLFLVLSDRVDLLQDLFSGVIGASMALEAEAAYAGAVGRATQPRHAG